VGVALFEQEFRRGACGATEGAFSPFVRYVYIPQAVARKHARPAQALLKESHTSVK